MKISNYYNDIKISNLLQKDNKDKDNIDFKKILFDSINKINTYEEEAEEMGLKLASGEIDNIHDVMIAGQKAEIALQFAIEVKNKIMDAYKEIMRIQL
ncbi:flagellar hook-basal body complex protein FliE [Caminicella sporogenes DSM 14501]|uniref:Flagellar hook-basal body complex protein FliE n=1 Tax=Caminicella sporogenes DSM 14501 TaxID=1121266 RepID=A0A1M6LCZ6_9FIRM|nr:flagellar hook-basal body complex protein FliE [Caminicella sporogenes]RKD27792.1 flagellar hook-basal body complex protein FliE [Caminicella sporogenes]WIF94631.1 flagellar hook-basal body complex protein FliE [Caminicella sporogenes]SHJ69059.1 flagellar hook-basal body complex protein FliE [Caminicella sporogenes DSM 14501]